MAEFNEVMKQYHRMCKRYHKHNCAYCPLEEFVAVNCPLEITDKPEESEKIIMKWAQEHPAKTNADKFKEVFGVEIDILEISESTNGCILKCGEALQCSKCSKHDFWSKEFEEPANR